VSVTRRVPDTVLEPKVNNIMQSLLEKYLYTWPHHDLTGDAEWKKSKYAGFMERLMPEKDENLAIDSRWPGFFPSAICFVTTTDGKVTGLEKVVGATIVNRFPYILALSFCTKPLSERHYVRERFMQILEAGGSVAVQYFEPGDRIDKVMNAISSVDDDKIDTRIAQTGLKTTKAQSNDSEVFTDAYMVYEGRLVKPGKDFERQPIFEKPYTDYGSHRIYYLEIEAIQLRRDIAHGQSQIHWLSLPKWDNIKPLQNRDQSTFRPLIDVKYQKGYTSDYFFPAKNTMGFEYDKEENGMSVKFLPPLPEDQVEVDNDRARWPCFFPSSVGMVTTWGVDDTANLMPCGSTSILVRHPLCFAICVSYAKINVRYAPRASLDALLRKKRFVCGVPFANDTIIDAIKYAGNISVAQDKDKLTNSGLEYVNDEAGPLLTALPVNYRCKVVDVVRLGTHFLLLGEVESVIVRDDVTKANCLKWYSYPDVEKVASEMPLF
jgi:flavin reductase (DIM6/NTAB) family NADH-FMN oxidoreductase RutF